jgi:hypothetical protein
LQDSSLEKLEKLSPFTYLPSTNFQIETAATAFLCGYLIMKITEAIHGCDYCLSHLRDPNLKKKIPLLELMYWVIQNDCGQVWQLCTKIYVATVWVG